ncbi:MAG TPA: hypothetical protein PK530_00270 [Anaerolineales bacterium]|nr:hypothetical protein [Anaerolineales bacterium]
MLFQPFLRDKDDGGGGALPPAETPPAKGSDALPPTSGDALPEKDGKGTGEEIKLSSAALKERLERAEKSAKAELLKAMGFESLAAAQKAVEEGKQLQREKMSEQERLQADLTALTDRATKAEQAAQQARLEAEALGLMAGKFANPRAALKLVDLTGVNLADGFTGLAEAINKLAETEPWTLAPQTQTPNGKKPTVPNLGPTNPETPTRPTKTDAERMQKFFGGGVKNSGFFEGGGVKITGGSPRIGGGS